MTRSNYTPAFKAKIVLEVLREERELGEIAAENNLNPNMVRNWNNHNKYHRRSEHARVCDGTSCGSICFRVLQ